MRPHSKLLIDMKTNERTRNRACLWKSAYLVFICDVVVKLFLFSFRKALEFIYELKRREWDKMWIRVNEDLKCHKIMAINSYHGHMRGWRCFSHSNGIITHCRASNNYFHLIGFSSFSSFCAISIFTNHRHPFLTQEQRLLC